ncbi:MAG TPA: bifunctional metallophosphatase/5'-nucleotidase [Rhizomicrobium sp.]|nr:bifunctional metallophosphatase/5'-nucleotidase [Rhizomicrobium sp.]
MTVWRVFAAALALAVAVVPAAAAPKHRVSRNVDVTILAINDFHGNLKSPGNGSSIPGASDADKAAAVGGAANMATLVKALRAKHRNSVFVAAGDLIGASPLLSGLFHDEPTVEALSLMGLDASAVGNHEFDEGTTELLRMQNGGCHPVDGCKGPHPFKGAKYRYLAASTINTKTGKPLFPPYVVKRFGGIPVAFIGLALKGVPEIVSPPGIAGYEFRDEADTVNALVPKLRAQGIKAIVVLIHEGGMPTGGYNECPGIAGPIVDIVTRFDKQVDLVVSGHTHQAYNCIIDGRLVTSAHRYGTMVTEIDTKLSRRTRDFISLKAHNVIVRDDLYPADPAEAKLIASYEAVAAPIEQRIVGSVTAPITREQTPGGETALGDVIADAKLAAAKDDGAQIALMNIGGIRTDIAKAGDVTYADLFAALPFGNTTVTLTLTGAQIKKMLEQQWVAPTLPRILQVSEGFSYAWDARKPFGDRVAGDSMMLNGQPMTPTGTYRVAVSDFLANGGDSQSVLKEGTNRVTGDPDLDAVVNYFGAHKPLSPATTGRIKRLD